MTQKILLTIVLSMQIERRARKDLYGKHSLKRREIKVSTKIRSLSHKIIHATFTIGTSSMFCIDENTVKRN